MDAYIYFKNTLIEDNVQMLHGWSQKSCVKKVLMELMEVVPQSFPRNGTAPTMSNTVSNQADKWSLKGNSHRHSGPHPHQHGTSSSDATNPH